MCGIIGIAGRAKTLTEPLRALSKRGPDEQGTLAFSGCALGHTRLSIIDLASGHQPMKSAARDHAIVFNGEIYNYKELRKELEALGHTFKTRSDTEVILNAYAQWHERTPERLDGQFAFAIWDNEKEQLFLARDPFGEKPLFIARTKDGFLFASEIKALLATGLVEQKIDRVSLDNYLALLYVPPWRSIYEGIVPLKPAHRAVWKNGTYTEVRYWQLKNEPLDLSEDEAAARVRSQLEDSVCSRMIADVEVGAFLSGGIDSSIIVRLAAQLSNTPLKTFSAGFEGYINELPYAREIAALAKTDHTESQMQENLADSLMEVSAYFDEPFGDSSHIPMSRIAALARERVKVALSGDGGDELFFGYGQYTRWNHLPKLQKLRNMLTGTDPYEYYRRNLLTQFSPQERKTLLKDSSALEEDPTTHVDLSEATTSLQKINLLDFYMALPGDMLAKVDRASMMHSLEVRSPFLNSALAQFAYNLPTQFKTDGRRGKVILEKVFKDTLPPGFFTRKKQGFGAPVGVWLRKKELRELFESWLVDPRMAEFLSMDAVRKIVERFYAGDDTLRYKVWILLSLEAWLRTRTPYAN
jgi:asparagine synthase (glutamine-hydrolysing)